MSAPIFLRDSFFGRIVYHLSGKKLFTYPEEKPGYVVADKYLGGSYEPSESGVEASNEKKVEGEESSNEKTEQSSDQNIIVTWDGDDDPENPYNWSTLKKVIFLLEIGLLTMSVYIGSAIFTPGEAQIMQQFGVSEVAATLPLSLFVFGYAVGPLFWSPFSEHPAIGRTYIYIGTLFIFIILQIPTALAKNIGSLLVLRFLAGFFASPSLATGGASVGDVLRPDKLVVGIATWAISAIVGPALGPLIGGAFAQDLSWRWTFWFLLILGGFTLTLLTLFLPETSQRTLLYRKTKRLRKLTGNDKVTSEADLEIAEMSPREVVIDTLWRPFEIVINEPMVLSINVYIALMYSVFYLWFEAFPAVFEGIHHLNLVQTGATFVAIQIGAFISCAVYVVLIFLFIGKKAQAGKQIYPEDFIPTAILGACIQPVGIFMFGWTSNEHIHWIVPLIGSAIVIIGAFMTFQSFFNYLGMSFPRYLASVFASNNLCRSGMAGAFPLFGRAMYSNLGPSNFPVGWGCSVLGFITLAMVAIPVVLYKYGKQLRARSKYAS